jgi:hypothetical protein
LDQRRADPAGRVVAEAFRLFQNPKFTAGPAPRIAAATNLDEAALHRL